MKNQREIYINIWEKYEKQTEKTNNEAEKHKKKAKKK